LERAVEDNSVGLFILVSIPESTGCAATHVQGLQLRLLPAVPEADLAAVID
jgi:hypothetical protein